MLVSSPAEHESHGEATQIFTMAFYLFIYFLLRYDENAVYPYISILSAYSQKWPDSCSCKLPAEMTQPEADTWPGKVLSKQKSNCKQIKVKIKVVLKWEALSDKIRGYITHPICKFHISTEKQSY